MPNEAQELRAAARRLRKVAAQLDAEAIRVDLVHMAGGRMHHWPDVPEPNEIAFARSAICEGRDVWTAKGAQLLLGVKSLSNVYPVIYRLVDRGVLMPVPGRPKAWRFVR